MYTLDTFVSLISASLSLCLTNRILRCVVVVCTRRVVRWCDARRGGDHIVAIPVSSRRPVAVPRDSFRVNRPRLGRLRGILLEKLRREAARRVIGQLKADDGDGYIDDAWGRGPGRRRLYRRC